MNSGSVLYWTQTVKKIKLKFLNSLVLCAEGLMTCSFNQLDNFTLGLVMKCSVQLKNKCSNEV